MIAPDRRPRANRILLDTSATAFGMMMPTPREHGPDLLRARLAEVGYLLLRRFLEPAAVLAAQQAAVAALRARGMLLATADPDRWVAADPSRKAVVDELARLPQVHGLVRDRATMEWFSRLLGAPARALDHTWFRFVPPGHSTLPHADIVYMGRGTRELRSLWVPLAHVDLDGGPLAVLEGSHRRGAVQDYCARDVEELSRRRFRFRHWRRVGEGKFSADARATQKELGGRWVTAAFAPGDVVLFGADVIHCSLDNRSEQVRLSVDTRFQRADAPCDPRWQLAAPPHQ